MASLLVAAVLPVSAWAIPSGGPARQAYEEGKAALRARDYPAAAAAFERAASLSPDDPSVHLNLGIARSGMKDQQGALAAYRRVLELNPRSAQANNNIGNVHFRQGQYEKAYEYYARAIELKPDYLLALYHLGWIARQLNRADEAEAAFARCLAIRPASPREVEKQYDARFYFGALRFRAKDYVAAAANMQQVLDAFPNHLEAHYYLGQSLLRLGRHEEAKQHLEIHKKLVESRRVTEPVASGGIR